MIERAYLTEPVAAVTCRDCKKVTLAPVSYEWIELWGRQTYCPVYVCECGKQQHFDDPYEKDDAHA